MEKAAEPSRDGQRKPAEAGAGAGIEKAKSGTGDANGNGAADTVDGSQGARAYHGRDTKIFD